MQTQTGLNGLLGMTSLAFLIMGSVCAPAEEERFTMNGKEFKIGETIYENPMSEPEDIEDWKRQFSNPVVSPSPENEGMLRMFAQDHFIVWCPDDFPDNIAVSWDFKPIARVDDRGLAMVLTAVSQKEDKDITEFHGSTANTLRLAYFRRNDYNKEVNFNAVTLKKYSLNNPSVRVVKPDPIPSIPYIKKPFRMQVIKYGPYFRFSVYDRVNKTEVVVLDWKDTGEHGPILEGGKIGFKHMRGLIADYSNLTVRSVSRVNE